MQAYSRSGGRGYALAVGCGAGGGIRTLDLLFTKQLLYL